MSVTEPGTAARRWMDGVDVDAVLRAQGADPAIARRQGSRSLATAGHALREGLVLVRPDAAIRRVRVERAAEGGVHLAGGGRLSGPLVAGQLARAREVVVAAVTVGRELGDAVASAVRRQPSFGLALEGVATAALEAWVGETLRRLDGAARQRGWRVGAALSPGMEGWPLDPGQQELFALLEPDQPPVRLLPSGMMWPRHSLSLVAGLGPGLAPSGTPCEWCGARLRCRHRLPNDH